MCGVFADVQSACMKMPWALWVLWACVMPVSKLVCLLANFGPQQVRKAGLSQSAFAYLRANRETAAFKGICMTTVANSEKAVVKSYIHSCRCRFRNLRQCSISIDEAKFGGENTLICILWLPSRGTHPNLPHSSYLTN